MQTNTSLLQYKNYQLLNFYIYSRNVITVRCMYVNESILYYLVIQEF